MGARLQVAADAQSWRINYIDTNPRTVGADNRFICDFVSFFSCGGASTGCHDKVISLRGGDIHLIQLPLHDSQLSPEDGGSYDPNQYQIAREEPDTARPLRHHPLIEWVLGGVFFCAAAAAVFVAFKSAEYADDHGSRFWWLPFGGFLAFAFWLADHALSFLSAAETAL